jgi:hypothetical protein
MPDKTISDTDLNINIAVRAAAAHRGLTMAELGRELMYPNASWFRKISDDPDVHQRYTADDLVRIARGLGLSTDDLVSGNPILGRRR